MKYVSDLAQTLATMAPSNLVMLVVLAAIGLAAFAIYAVHSIAKDKRR